MAKFIPIRYEKKEYPTGINPRIQETPANFNSTSLENTDLPYFSLHTDPAYGHGKKPQTDMLDDFATISNNFAIISNSKGIVEHWVPKLWYNKKWSEEFAGFIVKLVGGIDKSRIKIIEIHPPFNDYCGDLETFIDRYKIFEEKILKTFPDVSIHIENRSNKGTRYKKGKFLLSTNCQIKKLSKLISASDVKLKMVLDFPQLLTEHQFFAKNGPSIPKDMIEKIKEILEPVKDCKDFIDGMHIWGKPPPHHGTLDTLFNNNEEVKNYFLKEVRDLFDDGKERYFIPEVRSKSDDLKAIVNDFKKSGFEFINHCEQVA